MGRKNRPRGKIFRRVSSNRRLVRTICHRCNRNFGSPDLYYIHLKKKHFPKD